MTPQCEIISTTDLKVIG